ncbi:putative transposase [Trichonephila clavipes]|nr:putative transposase [Trichonephila clavipes]
MTFDTADGVRTAKSLGSKDMDAKCREWQQPNQTKVNHFLASKNIPVALQPPYSPDLSPCDFSLFPKLKNHLKGHHFGTLENILTAVTDQLKAIPISEFHQCYEEWKKRLQRCVASEGSYFEGDNVGFQMNSLAASVKLTYSASMVDRLTDFCLKVRYEIGVSSIKVMKPPIDTRSFLFVAKSESE